MFEANDQEGQEYQEQYITKSVYKIHFYCSLALFAPQTVSSLGSNLKKRDQFVTNIKGIKCFSFKQVI